MSNPTKINVKMFNDAEAQERPEPVHVKASLVPDMGEQETAEVEPVAAVAVEPEAPREITVGVMPVWGIALGWILLIVAASQAAKFVLKAVGLKDRMKRKAWRRWMYVVPVIVGTFMSALFGPQLGELFGLHFGMLESVVLLGPGSGAAAAFTYDVLRGVVLPLLPVTIIGVLERVTGLTLPDSIKDDATLPSPDSEAVLTLGEETSE